MSPLKKGGHNSRFLPSWVQLRQGSEEGFRSVDYAQWAGLRHVPKEPASSATGLDQQYQ